MQFWFVTVVPTCLKFSHRSYPLSYHFFCLRRYMQIQNSDITGGPPSVRHPVTNKLCSLYCRLTVWCASNRVLNSCISFPVMYKAVVYNLPTDECRPNNVPTTLAVIFSSKFQMSCSFLVRRWFQVHFPSPMCCATFRRMKVRFMVLCIIKLYIYISIR
jgi:hypothetical protein